MAITFESNKLMEKAADYVIYIPETDPYFANSLAIIPLQLLAYYIAIGKGCDVDKPRNLAKSVTVDLRYTWIILDWNIGIKNYNEKRDQKSRMTTLCSVKRALS